MKTSWQALLPIVVISVGTIIGFNNCTGNSAFDIDPAKVGVGSLNTGLNSTPGNNDPNSQDPPDVDEMIFDGKVLYAQNCAACHGDVKSSAKLGVSAGQIETAINTVIEMSYLKGQLNSQQIYNISMALVKDAGPMPEGHLISKSADIRMLTVREMDEAARVILQDSSRQASSNLPKDQLVPFDNDLSVSTISLTRVEKFETIAEKLAKSFVANDTRVRAVLPCIPGESSGGTLTSENLAYGTPYYVINVCSGKPIRVTDTANESLITIGTKNNTSAQVFTAVNSGGNVAFVNEMSGKCIDVPNNSTVAGADLIQWEFLHQPNQQWIAEKQSNGYYKFRSVRSNLYMEVTNGASADGTVVQQNTSSNSCAQQFALVSKNAAPANDLACIKKIVGDMGKVAYRRPLQGREAEALEGLFTTFMQKTGNYKDGLEVVVRILFQSPDFIYRWEKGTAVAGKQNTFRLNDYELASKIAFSVWGGPPDLALLKQVENGEFQDPIKFEAVIDKMLNDQRAINQADFFHASWLGYSELGDSGGLAAKMRNETKALIKRIIFDENRPWEDLLTFEQTFVDSELANHYKYPAPSNSSGAWVKPNDALRKGLFSHGAFLAVGGRFGDTSTTQRGYNIRKRIFCDKIPAPPPDVAIDEPPGSDVPSKCKVVKLDNSVLKPGSVCITCHSKMDNIGLGLENYSAAGVYRTVQPDAPECQITGDGEVIGYGGKFRGPAELGQIAVNSGRVQLCVAQHWMQFVGGVKDDDDLDLIGYKAGQYIKNKEGFKKFIKSVVTYPEFRLRRGL